MCEELTELRRATIRYCSHFDPETVTPAQAERVVADAKRITSAASALMAHAAARAAESDSWKRDGHRSAAEGLAADTGTSVSDARGLLDIGRRLQDQPEIDEAARKGELSNSQLSMITDAAEADPSAAKKLLDEAQKGSLAALRDACANTKADADPDPEGRRKRIRSKRSLRSWRDLEGIWHLKAQGNPEDGALVMASLGPITEALFHEARKEGRRERPDAYGFDALVAMAKESASAKAASSESAPRKGPPVKLLVRVDLDTLLRGAPKKGETCDLVGYGPISVSAIEDLCSMGSPFVAAILTKAKRITGVAHMGRRPNAHQSSALDWLYPACANESCAHQIRLQADHRVDWAKTHFTMFDLLDKLCSHDHALKTREGWELVEGRGRRAFVAPDDPRHPRHRRRPTDRRAKGPPRHAA